MQYSFFEWHKRYWRLIDMILVVDKCLIMAEFVDRSQQLQRIMKMMMVIMTSLLLLLLVLWFVIQFRRFSTQFHVFFLAMENTRIKMMQSILNWIKIQNVFVLFLLNCWCCFFIVSIVVSIHIIIQFFYRNSSIRHFWYFVHWIHSIWLIIHTCFYI